MYLSVILLLKFFSFFILVHKQLQRVIITRISCVLLYIVEALTVEVEAESTLICNALTLDEFG